jgi:signal transduction histidine kinase
LIVIATETHRLAFLDRLRARGVDVERASRKGLITLLDAAETLAKLMSEKLPTRAAFESVCGQLIAERAAIAPSQRVSAYGEMVDVLWRQGNADATLELEDIWNEAGTRHNFSLFCGYVINNSFSETGIREICAKHTHIQTEPSQTVSRAGGEPISDERARKLIGELAEEKSADRRADRLLRVTAAIADAVTPEQVFEAVVDHVAIALGASSGGLWLLHENGKHVGLVRAFGYVEAQKTRFDGALIDGSDRFPALDALRTGEPIWLVSQAELLERYPNLIGEVSRGRSYRSACLPLVVENRVVGTLAFTFEQAGSIDDTEKSFLQLVARYSSQAIERLRLLDAERRSRARAQAFAARMQSLSRENEAARDRAELLYSLARAVMSAESAESIFTAALDAIQLALGTDRSAILVFDSDSVMRFKAWRGLSDDYRRAVEGHSPWTRDARDPQAIFVPDAEHDSSLEGYRELFRKERIGALGFIPLVGGGRLMGKFMVYYSAARELSAAELDLARAIANHVAAAVARFEAVSALQRSVRFNEMFTAVLGHDLRNPLGAIMAAAQLANKRPKAQAIAKPLARILNSGERMARMIDQLLDFTRVRVGEGIPLQPKAIDIVDVVRHVVAELEIANPDWHVRVEQAGRTTGEWDEDRLLQVFSNLLANAVQHGLVDAGIEVHVDGSQAAVLKVSVHNMGAIPPELLPRLFDPMTAGERQRDKSQGLGLGLFISQCIAQAHGGNIEVESSHATGTRFTVLLPRREGKPG